MKSKKRLSVREILGYTIGSIGDSTTYNFVLSFFSFFMTTVAGVSPVVAGTIISIAIAWDAITDPIVGYMIDHSKSKKGKRRPYILKSLIPMGASMVLMFLNINLPQMQKNIYYLLLVLVFWTSYTAFNIPYYSFGSVLTDNDSERVRIAAFREVMGYVGIFCASSVPTFIVGKLLEVGMSDSKAWSTVALIAAIITVSTILIMWYCTRGKEPIEENENPEKRTFKDFFKEIWSLMKIKPYILVILCALFTNIYMTLFNSNLLYYATYNMGVGEIQASAMFTAMNVISIVLIPIITKSVAVTSKQKVFVFCMIFSGIVMVAAKFITIQSVTMGCIYVVLVGIGTCAYWMCIFNFIYDVIDFDEFKTGKKRDGIIISYYSFLLKLGGAIAAWFQGFLLQKSGFNVELAAQGGQTIGTIESLFTILPGICMILAGAVIIITPLKDKKMQLLRNALELKKEDKEYSTEGFKDIL